MTLISLYVQDGDTPLYAASADGNVNIVQILLKANASTDIANKVSFLI